MSLLNDNYHAILNYWFGSLTDQSALDPGTEPFSTHYARWYGKDPAVDTEIRERFEPMLLTLTKAKAWPQAVRSAGNDPRHNLALTLLVDQFPRNMYRGTARMYDFDGMAIAHAYANLVYVGTEGLTLVERMFAAVPLMHAEDIALQRLMESRFEELSRDAAERSPHNQRFFDMALEFAQRHRAIVERFSRFPHRNVLLERSSTPEELEALRTESIAF